MKNQTVTTLVMLVIIAICFMTMIANNFESSTKGATIENAIKSAVAHCKNKGVYASVEINVSEFLEGKREYYYPVHCYNKQNVHAVPGK